jgi:hypothetical protein
MHSYQIIKILKTGELGAIPLHIIENCALSGAISLDSDK